VKLGFGEESRTPRKWSFRGDEGPKNWQDKMQSNFLLGSSLMPYILLRLWREELKGENVQLKDLFQITYGYNSFTIPTYCSIIFSILTSILRSISITSLVRVLKHGFACSKKCYVDGVENLFLLKNIAFIWSHLLEKDKAITKKRWVLHIFLVTSQWLHKFTTFIISNPSCHRAITLAYSTQIILHDLMDP
jgi:hypothetical protein